VAKVKIPSFNRIAGKQKSTKNSEEEGGNFDREVPLPNMADIQMKTVRDSGCRESNFGIALEDLEERGSRNTTRGSTSRGSTFKRQFVINDSRESNYMLDEEEEDAGNVPFMNNPTLSSQDVSDTRFYSAKLLGEDILKAKSQLQLVHAINMLLFGDGKYVAVPICWMVLQLAVLTYKNVLFVEGNKLCALLLSQKAQLDAHENYICGTLSSYALTSTHFAYTINLSASLYFGWRTSKMVYVDKVLAGHCNKLALDARDQARRMLNRMIMSSALFFTGFYIVYNSANHIVGPLVVFQQQAFSLASLAIPYLFAVIDFMVQFIFYLSTFYIVGLWIWVTWIKSKVNQDLAQAASVEGIMDDSFIASFLHIYTSNAKKSKFWSVNHIIRVLVSPYCIYGVWCVCM